MTIPEESGVYNVDRMRRNAVRVTNGNGDVIKDRYSSDDEVTVVTSPGPGVEEYVDQEGNRYYLTTSTDGTGPNYWYDIQGNRFSSSTEATDANVRIAKEARDRITEKKRENRKLKRKIKELEEQLARDADADLNRFRGIMGDPAQEKNPEDVYLECYHDFYVQVMAEFNGNAVLLHWCKKCGTYKIVRRTPDNTEEGELKYPEGK